MATSVSGHPLGRTFLMALLVILCSLLLCGRVAGQEPRAKSAPGCALRPLRFDPDSFRVPGAAGAVAHTAEID